MKRILFFGAILLLAGCVSSTSSTDSVTTRASEFCDSFEQERADYWNVLSGKKGESAEIWRINNAKYKATSGRNLAVFIDGTGNTSASNTNVWKLYSLAVAKSCSHPVIPFYHQGVGTQVFQRILGGGLGSGIDSLITDGYQFLAEAYQPGDKIFIFGFSRGAYAARSLNGMVDFVGLLDTRNLSPLERQEQQLKPLVKELYKLYSRFNDGKYQFEERLRESIADSDLIAGLPVYGNRSPRVVVDAIGVFDTVPALGLGRDDFPDNHRTGLYAREGFHALAIDEQRNDFRPLLFHNRAIDDQVLKEVWFAGAHADIGGGYNDHYGLELLSRQWMRQQFDRFQIFSDRFDAGESCIASGARCEAGALHDEFLAKKFFGKFGLHWRLLDDSEIIHNSVLCRSEIQSLPVAHPDREPNGKYQPENLTLPPAYMTTTEDFSCRS